MRLGAIVLHRGKIVSRGHNKLKSHPTLSKLGYYGIHAECDALMRSHCGDTLIVVRILKNGRLACSKPCEKCLKFISSYGIKRVLYIDWNESVQEMRL